MAAKIKKLRETLVILPLAALLIWGSSAYAHAKRRIAVMPFEYGTAYSSIQMGDVGRGITSLLVTSLVQDGTYSVVDRQMLNTSLAEQDLSGSDRGDFAATSRIGQIISADVILVGTVTEFGVLRKDGSLHLPSVSSLCECDIARNLVNNLGTFSFQSAKTKVSIEARLIDINTTEVLGTFRGTGLCVHKGGGFGSRCDFSSPDFLCSAFGEATRIAVDQLVTQLKGIETQIPNSQSAITIEVQGKVADICGNQVIVNIGHAHGLKIGDNLKAQRPIRIVRDPTTGRVLTQLMSNVAIINVDAVNYDHAFGFLVENSGLRVGDDVYKVSTNVSATLLQHPN